MSAPITLNGDPAEAPEGETLAAMLERLGIEPTRVVVEHNRQIVRAERLDAVAVGAGDEVEIVRLVGGG